MSAYGQYATATDPVNTLISLSVAEQSFELTPGRQVEGGLKQSLKNGRAEWTFAAYRIVKEKLLVPDPLGGTTAPLRSLPPSGHVAGVISRLDRERGAYWTPANAVLEEVVDLDPALTGPEQAAVFGGAMNLLRCAPGGVIDRA